MPAMTEPSRLRENIITSYGLGWRRAEVEWERRQLLGRYQSGRQTQIMNFWGQSGIYVLFRSGKAYYVGIAPGSKAKSPRGLGIRIKDHLDDRLEMWDEFSWFGTRDITSNTDANGLILLGPARKSNDAAIQVWRSLHDMEALLFRVLRPAGNDLVPYFGERNEKQVREWVQIARQESGHYLQLARGARGAAAQDAPL
jgi:hypothetical protein